jgi:hypothetical protein
MNTELYIAPLRIGYLSITSGSATLTGVGTTFTSADVGKQITIRTFGGDKKRTISAYTSATNVTVSEALDYTQTVCNFSIESYNLDIYNDFPYSLNYSIADVREAEKRNSSFSKTIKIPGSKGNNIVFDHIFEIDLEGSYNPNLRVDAIVYDNYIPIFVGNLQLLRITRNNDKIEYEVAIFGKLGDLFQKIGDKLLTDLDLSSLNEYGNTSQIVNSWSSPDELFYPLLNNGLQQYQIANPSFSSEDIAPAIRVSTVFEAILESVGYAADDSATLYSETKMDKLYIPCTKNWRRKASFNISGDVIITLLSGFYFVISVTRIKNGLVETFFTNSFSYSAGTYTFEATSEVELNYGDTFQIIAYKTGISIGNVDLQTPTNLTLTYLDLAYTYNTNGGFEVESTGNTSVSTVGVVMQFDTIISSPLGYWNILTDTGGVPPMNTAGFLPDNFKQRDFLIGLIRMFNLYIEPDKESSSVLNILPRDTYYSQGSIVDWTYKADNAQDLEEVPMGELDWKEYLLTYKNDGDWYNKDYTSKYKEVYGQRLILTENDFITAKKKIELPFSQTPLVGSELHELVLPSVINENIDTNTNRFNGNIRLLYYASNQLIGLNTSYYKINGANYYSYPFSGHLIGTPQAATYDFNFAAPREINYVIDNPDLYPINDNLYISFYQNFLLEITDKYSKLVSMYLNLTSEDIRNLDFRDIYFINQTYYRLNKVIDYNPTGQTLTKCEFLRIRDAVEITVSSSYNVNQGNTAPVATVTPKTFILTNKPIGDLYQKTTDKTAMQVGGFRGKVLTTNTPTDGDVYVYRSPSGGAFSSGFDLGFSGASDGFALEPLPSGGGTVTSVNAGTNISVTGTATDPVINSLSDRYKTSSVTSNSVSNGSKSFTVDLNLSYIPLQEILVVYDPAHHMHGEVTSYNPATGALVVDIKHHTGSGTYTSWVINLDGTPVDALSGIGTTNEIAYFTGAQTLSSLAVATYPSLTELSYVKGVTSAIQTQIDGKQATLGFTPEDVANKQTNLAASATKYPTVNAVNTGINNSGAYIFLSQNFN